MLICLGYRWWPGDCLDFYYLNTCDVMLNALPSPSGFTDQAHNSNTNPAWLFRNRGLASRTLHLCNYIGAKIGITIITSLRFVASYSLMAEHYVILPHALIRQVFIRVSLQRIRAKLKMNMAKLSGPTSGMY